MVVLSVSVVRAQGGDAEVQLWSQARATGGADGFRRYLEAHPAGRFASEAFRCLVEARLLTAPSKACTEGAGLGPPAPTVVRTGNYVAEMQ